MINIEAEESCFLGQKPCGCYVAAVMSMEPNAARLVRQWKKKGWSVHIAQVAEAREVLKSCRCGETLKLEV